MGHCWYYRTTKIDRCCFSYLYSALYSLVESTGVVSGISLILFTVSLVFAISHSNFAIYYSYFSKQVYLTFLRQSECLLFNRRNDQMKNSSIFNEINEWWMYRITRYAGCRRTPRTRILTRSSPRPGSHLARLSCPSAGDGESQVVAFLFAIVVGTRSWRRDCDDASLRVPGEWTVSELVPRSERALGAAGRLSPECWRFGRCWCESGSRGLLQCKLLDRASRNPWNSEDILCDCSRRPSVEPRGELF